MIQRMIRVTTFAGKTAAVFGLGASGNATAQALMAGGAAVAAWDDCAASRAAAESAGVPLVDLRTADWGGFAALVLAPGVPLTHPEPHWTVNKARASGIEVIGDIELFCRERALRCPDSPFIAITGTNGKSTTSALVAHMLRTAGKDTQLGGNIGTAVLALEPPAQDRFHVIEMSSFQIDLAPSLRPTVGVLLNLSPDHLDRHGTFQNYMAIKERLPAGADTAVVGVDDSYCRAIATRLAAAGRRLLTVSVGGEVEQGVVAEGSRLAWVSGGRKRPLADLAGIGSLRGSHNAQNAAAAAAVARVIALGASDLQRGLSSYPGLAHRMEEIGRLGRVLFINDSKATNADSTEKALASFPGHIFWILGGKPKDGGIASLREYFPRISKAYVIGAATEEFAATLGAAAVPFERCGTLEVAVSRAADAAAGSADREPIVLLSPACASYDQFINFEHRGELFRQLVAALPGVELTPRRA
jgi:UDP-N-acetylmuramoylalanine--D-glutamate ligase